MEVSIHNHERVRNLLAPMEATPLDTTPLELRLAVTF